MTAPAERPLALHVDLARATLEGRKTETRRPVRFAKGQDSPPMTCGGISPPYLADGLEFCHWVGAWSWFSTDGGCACKIAARSPFGFPGDLLYVRETFADVHPIQVADGRSSMPSTAGIPGPPGVAYRTIFRADGPYPAAVRAAGPPFRRLARDREDLLPGERGDMWRSPLNMSKRSARIWLRVEEVRVERVQGITDEGAKREGFDPAPVHGEWVTKPRDEGGHWSARKPFADTWDRIYGKRPGLAWADDPWVWVCRYSVASTTGRAGVGDV